MNDTDYMTIQPERQSVQVAQKVWPVGKNNKSCMLDR